jgi:copper chaperone NosL
MKLRVMCIIVSLQSAIAGLAFAGPLPIPEGSLCHVCGMKVDAASPFAAQAIDNGKLLPFCDIGDMLHYYGRAKAKPAEVYVKDFETNEWTDALRAAYVKSPAFKTPMSWEIAAFKDKQKALKSGAVMSFDEALASISGGMPMKKKMH